MYFYTLLGHRAFIFFVSVNQDFSQLAVFNCRFRYVHFFVSRHERRHIFIFQKRWGIFKNNFSWVGAHSFASLGLCVDVV